MYGNYDVPMSIEQEGVFISVQKEGEGLVYVREGAEENVKKSLLADNARVLINPVEPLNKPKVLTPYLFMEFQRSLVIEPKTTKNVFLKFPIEVGVYVSTKEDFQVLDIFTLTRKKFTLYGDPRNGVLCKHWKSDVYQAKPSTNLIQEGVMELSFSNENPDWVEINKAIFNAYGMKIYYNDHLVSMKAFVRIKSGDIAETDFVNASLEEGMNKSLEIYSARKLSITSTRFTMEYGL